MIFIYGDSHAESNFKNLRIANTNCYEYSITMHRIGRDRAIINFSNSHLSSDNIYVLQYGEVDCRCHIGRQIALGREVNDICVELVSTYFESIAQHITVCKKIIVCAVVPPTRRNDYESVHGPIRHAFPFIGTDAERVEYTTLVNNLIKEYCDKYGYVFFDPYDYYKRSDGTLKYELSDGNVHIANTSNIISRFELLVDFIQHGID